MVNHQLGGLALLGTYIVFCVVGEFGAYLGGRLVDSWVPAWSLMAFLALFLSVLILAWPLALRATRAYDPSRSPTPTAP